MDDKESTVVMFKKVIDIDISFVGSCNIDLISYVSRLPVPGETIEAKKFSMGYGGKGANQCVMASQLGAKTAMVAKLGSDVFGKMYLDVLDKKNINTDYVTFCDEPTGMASAAVDDTGQNSIIVANGANLFMSQNDVEAAHALIANSKMLVTVEVPLAVSLAAMKLARSNGVPTIFNAGPAYADTPDELFENCDVLCVNESEAEILTGKSVTSVVEAKYAAQLLARRGCKWAIITMGSDGAVFVGGPGKGGHVPAKSVDVVDATGAGDAFVGSLAYYLTLMPHLSMHEMVTRCCDIASRSVEKRGTQSSYVYKRDLPKELFQ